MANRRLGGMGSGPQRGNRSFSQHQPFQRNNVSPWQGNMSSNTSMNHGGLLGQITTNPQQAQQLALALTNLLQPQQQQMNNPPSLLSLNTSPAFSHQDNRDSFNRFGNRPRSDFRRNDPYNKNRNGGWRQLDSNKNAGRNRNYSTGRDHNRKPLKQQKSSNKDDNKEKRPAPKNDKKDEKDSIKIAKVETEENISANNRDEDTIEETKRDWKEEKNTSDENAKKNNDAEEVLTENPKTEDVNKGLEGKYYGVPTKFLHCFVCNKDMWDGESFQKHLRGHAHKQMLRGLEESFHITVNILRENMRLSEEKKVIELNRLHRLSKNKFNRKFQEPESHCNMCDLKFLGKIITHRKTEGHQRLKRFLHPNCDICSKEFPGRMDWVEHRLTPDHLRQLNEALKNKAGGEEGSIIQQELEVDLEPLLEESIEMEEENPIVELTDELNNFQNRMPAYKKTRPVGTLNLKPFTGFMCDICFKSFDNEDFATEHLKTQSHYYNFIEAVKLKFKKQSEELAEKEAESKKRKREEIEQGETDGEKQEENEGRNGSDEMYDPEEACNEEEEVLKLDADSNKKDNNTLENSTIDDETVVKEEFSKVTASNTNIPRVTRRSGAGVVKNGGGIRNKKARKM